MSLTGRASEIKEQVLGVELFGRGKSFDPQTDPIVRTEVSRLRTKLKVYYNADGRDDEVIIEVPPRSYAPVFRTRGPGTMAAMALASATPRRRRIWTLAALLIAGGLVSWLSYTVGRARATQVRSEVPELTSVLVLPFANSDDGDPELEQFADGLTEEVIETIAEIDGIRVVPRTSAFQFKGKQVDLRTVAATLNVGSVLEGSIHRSGNRLRITTRLLNAAEGGQYYTHVFEHELKDVFTIQEEIAQQVANAMRVRQRGDEVARFTKNPEAHRLYLQGLYHASRNSESELREAVDCYERAIGFDPNYSPAYASLSDAEINLALLNEAMPRDAMQRAAAAARMAVKKGETYAHSHAALGSVLALYEWDWAGAEKEFRKAIAGDPDDSSILQQYVMRYLVPRGNLDSGLFELQLAQKVDPFSAQVALNRGRVQLFRREPAQALRAFQAALDLDPELETAPLALAEAYSQSTQFPEAVKTLQESSTPTEDEARLAVLSSVYALSRQPERARQLLPELLLVDRDRHISGYYFAQVYLALGQRSDALGWLEKAAEERSPLIVYIKVAAQFDRLRTEPRFQALLKRIGLEPPT